MNTNRKLAAISTVAAFAVGLAGSAASAGNQVLTATVASTVTIDTTPADVALGTLPVTSAALGDVVVSANAAYTLKVKGDNDKMTGWTGAAYNANELDASLLLTAVADSLPAVGVAAVVVSTSDATLATNPFTALLTTTDTYTITATQAATALDPADSYRMQLTYSASLGI